MTEATKDFKEICDNIIHFDKWRADLEEDPRKKEEWLELMNKAKRLKEKIETMQF